jgi:UDP:flavonoid glycosyltransferase YjiC (YdhE family)
MRIALAAEGTRGDVYPMLALGESLRAAGHEVLLCGPPDFGARARARGLDFHPVGTDVREYLTAHADAIAGGNLRVVRAGHAYFDECIGAQFRSLPEATRGADQIIGAGIQFAGPSVAELHGIPYRYIAYCPCVLPSAEHPPFLLPAQSLPRWVNRLAWWFVLVIYSRLLRGEINRQRSGLGLAPVTDGYRYLLTERPMLAADAELAPRPTDCPFDVEQVPCLHPMEGGPLPAKIEAFLEQGPPPIYLGFGSMTDPDPAATTRELLQAVATVGCRALISEGWAGLGEGALPEGVLPIGAVSHTELFPRLAAVVHHGGAGTTTTAARCGVPQIVVPHLLDQFYWARRVEALGLGPPGLPRTRLTGPRLAASLSATLDNEFVSHRAREIGERLRSQLSSSPSAATLLQSAPAVPSR